MSARVGLPADDHAVLPNRTAEARQARACLVKLAGSRFAVEVRYAREVVVFDEYTVVPLAPSHLLGVVNLRGSIMPLVDIRPFLGLEAVARPRERGRSSWSVTANRRRS